jgi:hypothetical protein
MFVDTMNGLQVAASDTYQGWKEWAKTPRSASTPRDSSRGGGVEHPSSFHVVANHGNKNNNNKNNNSSTTAWEGTTTNAVKDTMDDMHVSYQPYSNNNVNINTTNNNKTLSSSLSSPRHSSSTAPTTASTSLLQQAQQASRDPSHSPSQRPRHSSPISGGGEDDMDNTSLLQDLAWPFMACVTTASHAPNHNRNNNSTAICTSRHASRHNSKSSNTPTTTTTFTMMQNMIIHGTTTKRSDSFGGDSIVTLDTMMEEEARQLKRLTSWGTAGTYGTIQTVESIMTERTQTTYGSSIGGDADTTNNKKTLFLEDDDGNIINPVLLEKAQKKRHSNNNNNKNNKSSNRRKRLVKFDYPPISSLRECPRSDPNERTNLFFTEEELEQMEEDRFSTLTADDVEIVAVGSPESDVSSVSPAASFSNVKPSPRHWQQQQHQHQQQQPPASGSSSGMSQAHQQQARRGGGGAVDWADHQGILPTPWEEEEGDRSRSTTTNNNNPPRKKRSATPRRPKQNAPTSPSAASSDAHLIRGVQIYLRERSTPC